MNNWIKKNKDILIGGLFPGAIAALASLAAFYSIWVSLAACLGSFIVVNAFILLIEYLQQHADRKKKVRELGGAALACQQLGASGTTCRKLIYLE